MPGPNRERWLTLGTVIAIATLPLSGAWIDGRHLAELWAFPPPLRLPTHYPAWSWIAFALVSGLLTAITISWGVSAAPCVPRADYAKETLTPPRRHPFPWWGWAAVAWVGSWWFLAWTRLPWFAPLQRFTFFPLWIGFIATVCALTWARTGRPSLLARPSRALPLFAISAAFWWVFEWLNRFVHNWHYLGVEGFGAIGYAVHASVCFSTVLPAVFAVREWLGSFHGFVLRTARGPAWRWLNARGTGVGFVVAGVVGLVLTGIRPQEFYAAVWLAPLLLTCGLGLVRGRSGFWSELACGDWRSVAAWALAALICGFWWEMWNVFSAAKWIYTVPYVERWRLFEMPALGYAGYLAFGIECRLVVAQLGAFRSGETQPGDG